MRQQDAKLRLCARFATWAEEEQLPLPTGTWQANGFFAYLVSHEQHHLLDFRCAYDRWQRLKSWLIEAGLVT